MFRLMLPGCGRVAHAQREGPSTAKKEPGEKPCGAKRCESSWRCDTLSKFDSKDLQFVPAPDDLKTSQSYKEELILEEGSTQRGECPQASEAGQGGKQDRATGCYQPFPTLILGCFIWFKMIFLFSISFRIKILRSQFLCCFEVYFHFL